VLPCLLPCSLPRSPSSTSPQRFQSLYPVHIALDDLPVYRPYHSLGRGVYL
ncbi:hypothetical protein B0H13DRAFT_2262615, partial [Mycena leptocephala]